jgi:hypothetical protein
LAVVDVALRIAAARAREWLEKYGNHLVEKYFGAFPEAGASAPTD